MKTLLVRPVLVPTKDTESILVIDDNSRRLHICKPNEAAWGHQQIVLVSLDPNEKIEVGDLHIRFHNGKVGSNIDNSPIEWCHKYKYKKVIVAQDQLSPDHIHKLVDEYNNGEMQNFEIEMDWILGDKEDENQNLIPVLQPKLTNNFITIVEKEHNFPYPEEPMEEDGELVYSDGRFGILNDPKINGVDYENTPVPNYEESEDIFSKHKGSSFFSDETIEKMACFPTIKCLDKKLPCYNHDKCMLDEFLELHNEIIYIKNNDSNLYTEEEAYNLIKKFDTCYMGKFMGPDAREEWFNNNKKK